jgi:hypothetical protein
MTERSRYAHVEREQRWLVAYMPDGAVRIAEIVDRYIIGTHRGRIH